MARRDPRKGRARLVAWLSTAVSVLLACGKGIAYLLAGEVQNAVEAYDPGLAVLTATLVALIWYTYFTFLAVIGGPGTVVAPSLEFDADRGVVRFCVRNGPSTSIAVRMWFGMYFDSEARDLPEVLCGRQSVSLGPGEWFVYEEACGAFLGLDGCVDEVVIRGFVAWTDQFGVKGEEGPAVWRIEPRGTRRCERIYSVERARALLTDTDAWSEKKRQ